MSQLSYTREQLLALAEAWLKDNYNPYVGVRTEPYVCILGKSRVGKDYLARYLMYNTNLRYNGTCSLVGMPFATYAFEQLTKIKYTCPELYEIRHQYSKFLFDLFNALRDIEIAALPSLALQDSDLLVGVRSKKELEGCYQSNAYYIWIDSSNDKADPTLEFSYEDVLSLAGIDRTYYTYNNLNSTMYLRNVANWLDCDYPNFLQVLKHPSELKLQRHGIWLT